MKTSLWIVAGVLCLAGGTLAEVTVITKAPASQPSSQAATQEVAKPIELNPLLLAMMNEKDPPVMHEPSGVKSGGLFQNERVVGTVLKPMEEQTIMSHRSTSNVRIDGGLAMVWGHPCQIIIIADRLPSKNIAYSAGKKISVQGTMTAWRCIYNSYEKIQYTIIFTIPDAHVLYCHY